MIRNAVVMDYPVVESIKSVLPLVDEMIVAVGQSEDDTKGLIAAIQSPKIKIIDTHWDTGVSGGLILSQKTNEALAHCANDWCLYIQADEVLHEEDHPRILAALKKAEQTPHVQGLLFEYIHFYGAYNIIATSRRWYRNEIRVIKKSTGIQSVGDAQGFRINGEKPTVLSSGAKVFHYGWVKPPEKMRRKKKLFDRFWHGSARDAENEAFDFEKLYGLRYFKGHHPNVMSERVSKQSWSFTPERVLSDWSLRDVNLWASDLFEKVFRFRIGEYKPYRLLKE